MIVNDEWIVRRRGSEYPIYISCWANVSSWLSCRREMGQDVNALYEWTQPAACGCCARWRPRDAVREVASGVHRCEKHVGRQPCCIVGCGKTFAIRPGDDYEGEMMCGRHWRQAPKPMRDLERLIRQRAKRKGWNEKLVRQHYWIWQRARRAVEKGHTFDITAVNKLFGWDD